MYSAPPKHSSPLQREMSFDDEEEDEEDDDDVRPRSPSPILSHPAVSAKSFLRPTLSTSQSEFAIIAR